MRLSLSSLQLFLACWTCPGSVCNAPRLQTFHTIVTWISRLRHLYRLSNYKYLFDTFRRPILTPLNRYIDVSQF